MSIKYYVNLVSFIYSLTPPMAGDEVIILCYKTSRRFVMKITKITNSIEYSYD